MRLLTFTSTGVGELTDQYLRGQLRDALRAQAGLRCLFAGRGAGEPGGRRVVATLWDEGAINAHALAQLLPAEAAGPVGEPSVELFDVALEHSAGAWESATILRIFRGRAQPGLLETYLADVRSGTLQDVSQGHGPLGLFLARTRPDEFLTLSVWSSWSDIEQATGGSFRQPFATRRANQLAGAAAEHLEIVPHSTLVVPGGEDRQRPPLANPVAG